MGMATLITVLFIAVYPNYFRVMIIKFSKQFFWRNNGK